MHLGHHRVESLDGRGVVFFLAKRSVKKKNTPTLTAIKAQKMNTIVTLEPEREFRPVGEAGVTGECIRRRPPTQCRIDANSEVPCVQRV